MKVAIGSKSVTKVDAVREAFAGNVRYKDVSFITCDISGDASEPPFSLDLIVKGAIERAHQAFEGCDLSVGIEGGLMAVPGTASGYMEVAVCAIYDGTRCVLGLSPGFEWPKPVVEHMLRTGVDSYAALVALGYGDGQDREEMWVRASGGVNRKEGNRIAVRMAFVRLERSDAHPIAS